ncbi:hypothetical protein B0H10DRAFT_2223512 [Mycena sp. CBHHK59/15]|nr:hypothetical protein B0H10DRAFT_2223512 [Mycena sp. CBHHK59/15]
MAQTHIFITGATGYVGGTVLSRLFEHKDAAHFDITALVRSAEMAEKLKNASGINVVVGSHSDLELVETLAFKAGVIFSMADCDDLELAKAQLRGAKKKFEATGIQSEFIHVSGTGCLADDSFGTHGPKEIIDDIDSDRIAALPITNGHRNVDIELVEADKQGYVKTYIVVLGAIYGTATGKFADAGAHHTRNRLIAGLCGLGIARKEAFLIGEGKNEWPHVEIGEAANLIALLYDSIASKPENTAHGADGYYFAENGGYAMFEFSNVIQEVLVKAGRAKAGSKGPTQFSTEERAQLGPALVRMVSGNARCKSSRSRSLGWNPVRSDFLTVLREDLEITVSALH